MYFLERLYLWNQSWEEKNVFTEWATAELDGRISQYLNHNLVIQILKLKVISDTGIFILAWHLRDAVDLFILSVNFLPIISTEWLVYWTTILLLVL